MPRCGTARAKHESHSGRPVLPAEGPQHAVPGGGGGAGRGGPGGGRWVSGPEGPLLPSAHQDVRFHRGGGRPSTGKKCDKLFLGEVHSFAAV